MDTEIQKLKESITPVKDEMIKQGKTYYIDYIEVDKIDLLDVNAHWMDNELFNKLVSNIAEDKQLSSTPLLVKNGSRYTVLSGNHRVQAIKKAGSEQIILCFIINGDVTESKKLAIQLSHNSLVGQDDMVTLKKLYNDIRDIQFKQYAGLSDNTLELLDKLTLDKFNESYLDFEYVGIAFLPHNRELFENIIDSYNTEFFKKDKLYLASKNDYDAFMTIVKKTKRVLDIKNTGIAFTAILEMARERLLEREKELKNGQ